MTTITIQGYGSFEIPTERVGEVVNLLRGLSASKLPEQKQMHWTGNVLLNETATHTY